MTSLWILLALGAGTLLVWRALIHRSARQVTPSLAAPDPVTPADSSPVVPTQWVMPETLARFRRVETFELPVSQLEMLRTRLLALPRPQSAALKLLSSDFLESASAEALANEILREPHLAAQVMATVNSPFYGMSQPVASVQEAITYLGRDTVRSVALRCLVGTALVPTDKRLLDQYDTHTRASRLAAQLCQILTKRIGLTDSGAMVTAAVLSYVGHMAMLAMRTPEHVLQDASIDFLARSQREQDEIGLSAGELGCLLLEAWDIPATIVEDVRQIDRVVTTPPRQLSPQKAPRYALTYYAVRVADKLASRTWINLECAVPERLVGPEFFHAQTHFMIDSNLGRLAVEMRSPQVLAEVERLVSVG